MQGAARRDRDPIGTDRFAVGKKYRESHMRILVGGIEDARGLVRDQSTVGK